MHEPQSDSGTGCEGSVENELHHFSEDHKPHNNSEQREVNSEPGPQVQHEAFLNCSWTAAPGSLPCKIGSRLCLRGHLKFQRTNPRQMGQHFIPESWTRLTHSCRAQRILLNGIYILQSTLEILKPGPIVDKSIQYTAHANTTNKHTLSMHACLCMPRSHQRTPSKTFSESTR
jgi:hypothetical protein